MSRAQMLGLSYSVWKTVVQANGFTPYFHEDDGVTGQGFVFAGTDEYIYTTRIVDDTWVDFDTTFSGTTVAVGRRDDAIANIVGLSDVPKTARTDSGKLVISTWPTEGARTTVISPNWADPTTWYSSSTHISHEVASATTPGTVYQLAHSNIIDTSHGKISGEGVLVSSGALCCTLTVSGTVSGTGVFYTEVDPHTGVGDYTLDYLTGVITFSPAIAADAEVKATYHYETGSLFTIAPTAGKALKIKNAEVQFSDDVEVTDTVLFQLFGLVDVFAPQLLQVNGGPYPPGTKILLNTIAYKTMMDYINESNGALPAVPQLGGAGWRASPALHVFPWRYQAMTELKSSLGLEIRISLEHEVPFNGTVATATFYCLSEDE